MKYPRIALWIKWRFRNHNGLLHRWAVRRVDRWHEERYQAEQDKKYAAMFEKTWANFPRKGCTDETPRYGVQR